MIKDAVRDGLRAVKNAIEDGKYHLSETEKLLYSIDNEVIYIIFNIKCWNTLISDSVSSI